MSGGGPLRRAAGAVAWRASASVRALPDFLVIGAQKAGTTSLYDTLCADEDVLAARKKEVRFFDRHWDRGVLWYRWSFPTRAALRPRRGARRITGEATPDYLVHPLAPARVASLLPGCRLVVSLRHPVDRAHSQYRMNLALGLEDRGFEAAVEAELALLEARPADDLAWGPERNALSYVERSRYHPQLRRWFDRFDRSALHVTTLEAVVADPQGELDQVRSFLGLGPAPAPLALARSNRRDYDDLPADLRARLFALFAEDLERTEELLGRPLGYTAGP